MTSHYSQTIVLQGWNVKIQKRELDFLLLSCFVHAVYRLSAVTVSAIPTSPSRWQSELAIVKHH